MATKNEMRAVLKNKFLCQDKFTNDIENLVQNNNDMNYIEAICHYCEENSIEIESVGKLITCLLYTSPSPRDLSTSRMPSSD